MDAVIIPAKTTVHIGGIPVRLALDTIVETASMALLMGYHYCGLPDDPQIEALPTGVDVQADGSKAHPQTSEEQRLKALATDAVKSSHYANYRNGRDATELVGGHSADFADCPHADCALVRL